MESTRSRNHQPPPCDRPSTVKVCITRCTQIVGEGLSAQLSLGSSEKLLVEREPIRLSLSASCLGTPGGGGGAGEGSVTPSGGGGGA